MATMGASPAATRVCSKVKMSLEPSSWTSMPVLAVNALVISSNFTWSVLSAPQSVSTVTDWPPAAAGD